MAKQKGRAFLIRIYNGTTYDPFAGLTAKSLKLDSERIDVTTPNATTPEGIFWRETLSGVKSVSVSGDATLVDEAAEARLIAQAMLDDATDLFEIFIPEVGTFSGSFAISVEYSGAGDLTFSMSLESTGAVTFASV